MLRIVLCGSLVMFALGCGGGAVQKMGGSTGSEPWPELEAFEGGPLLSVAYPKEMGNWAEVKRALSSPEFAQALATFESGALPSAYSGNQAKKDAMVAAWKAAIEAAQSGSQDELKAKVEAALTATNSVRG